MLRPFYCCYHTINHATSTFMAKHSRIIKL
jgi:hypothetical protein